MILNIMFNLLLGRFQLNQIFELLLFSVSTIVPFNCCVYSCRPFVAITTSSAGLVGCKCFYCLLSTGCQGRAASTRPAGDVIATKGLQE